MFISCHNCMMQKHLSELDFSNESHVEWFSQLLGKICAYKSNSVLSILLPKLLPSVDNIFSSSSTSSAAACKCLPPLLEFCKGDVAAVSYGVKVSLARLVFGLLLLQIEKTNGQVASDVADPLRQCAQTVDPQLFRENVLGTLNEGRQLALQQALRTVLIAPQPTTATCAPTFSGAE